MAEAAKDTIYVDIDDDITSIIDKVATSKHKIVALVLPKRASTLQSIVNMKLLKRSGDTHKKQVVLITSEANLLPLAGAVKLHVAKTLQTKPAIPAAPKVPSDDVDLDDSHDVLDQADDEDELEDAKTDDPEIDKKKPVGELSGAAAGAASGSVKPLAQGAQETIEIDDDGDITDVDPKQDKKAAKAQKKAGKKLAIPNFNQFRTRLMIGGGVFVLLIIFWIFAAFVMPRARIVINTDNISVDTEVAFTANTRDTDFDADKALLPAIEKSVKKTDSEKVPATGKKNVGEKATGTVSLQLTDCSQNKVTVPAGTAVANNGLNFIIQQDIVFRSYLVGGICANTADFAVDDTTATVKVTAQNPGDQFNISGGRKFTVAGFGNVTSYDSSAMSGGTNREVTIVSANDIESAKQKMTDKSKEAATSELKKQLEDVSMFAIVETLNAAAPEITPAPAVDSEASEVTVTSVTTYTMLGVKRGDLKTLVENEAKKKIDTSKQSIGNDGLDDAVFTVKPRDPASQQITVQSTVSTGAQDNQDELKKLIVGKKKGEIQQILGARPGVKSVDVFYSPFWVYKAPSSASKITIEFKQATND